jgi:hypothetical protein
VETDQFARVHRTRTARRSTQARRLCSSLKIQKQAAFGINPDILIIAEVRCKIRPYAPWRF